MTDRSDESELQTYQREQTEDQDERDSHTWSIKLNKMVILAIFFSFAILMAVGYVGIANANDKAERNSGETVLLGRCIFQAQVYRARVTEDRLEEAGQTEGINGEYPDLKLPEKADIHLDGCQKYLEPITSDLTAAARREAADSGLLPPILGG